MTATEEKLDEMLKELEDINKSITSPTSSSSPDDADDGHDCKFNLTLFLLHCTLSGFYVLYNW